MRVHSGFDGCGTGYQALKNLGIPVSRYYANEVDKPAISIALKNHPDIVQCGDITDQYPPNNIDLMIAGSPCQGFSFAGKQLAFDDPRSKLFFEWYKLFEKIKPKWFLFENVRMKQASQDVISRYLGVQPIEINSSLVSAQNRKRLYWTNIPVAQPKDRGVVLQDILENGFSDRDKSHCIDANYFKGGNLKSYFEKHRRQLVFSNEGLCHVGDADLKGHDSIKRVYHPEGKAPTLTTMQGGHREPKVLVKGGRVVNRRLNKDGVRKDYDKSIPLQSRLELRDDDKTNCLTTITKDSVVVNETLRWRKLTPIECERLQTLPDNYTEGVSNTQRYKMLGNGMTCAVIEHILKGLL